MIPQRFPNGSTRAIAGAQPRVEILADGSPSDGLPYCRCDLRNADPARTAQTTRACAFALVQAQTSRAPLFNQNSSDKMSRSVHAHPLTRSPHIATTAVRPSPFASQPSAPSPPSPPPVNSAAPSRAGIDGKCSHRTVYRDTIAL